MWICVQIPLGKKHFKEVAEHVQLLNFTPFCAQP